MTKAICSALLVLLTVATLILGACGSPSGPELTVRAYFDAVNARDQAKFVGLWSADHQDAAAARYEFYTTFERKFPTVKKITIADFGTSGDMKDATAEVVEESPMGTHEKTLKLGLTRQGEQWLVFSAP